MHTDSYRRHPLDAETKLARWVISQGGTNPVSKKLQVHQVTVCSWLARRAMPSLEMTVRLLEVAKGEITTQDIYEATKGW